MIFKRPWLVFIQSVAILLFTGVSWLRFGLAVSLFGFLNGLPLAVSPIYQIVSGLVWGVAGLMVSLWLWKGHRKAPTAFRILVVTFALYYWVDQLLVMTSEIRQTNWLFSAVITIMLVLLVFFSFRPAAVKEYFGEKNDQEK
jgi:hypothetical protein